MNHKVTLAVAAILVVTALTAVAFAVPQQALAYKHNHNNHSYSIKVDQQINQLNNCTGTSLVLMDRGLSVPHASTDCQNFGDNQADISK